MADLTPEEQQRQAQEKAVQQNLAGRGFGNQAQDNLIHGLYSGPRDEALRADNGGVPGDRSWQNVVAPSSYEYGGYEGGAADEEQRYQNLANAADMRQAPQMRQAAYNAQRALELQHAAAQDQGLGYYQSMIEGTGPSLAAQQQAAGLSAAGAQGQQVMGNARGAQGLIAAQNAGIGAGGAGAASAFGMGATGRAGEELGALHGYSGLAQQRRSQDLQRAGLSADQAFRQAQLEAGQRALNDRYNLGLEGMRQNVFQQQLGAQQAGEAANAGIYNTNADLALRQQEAAQAQQNALMTGGVSAAGTGLAALGKSSAGGKTKPKSLWDSDNPDDFG